MHTQTFNMHFIRNNQASLMHTCAGDRINYEKKKESCSNATCNHTIRSYRLVKRLKQNTDLVIHFFFIRVIVLRSDAIYSIKFMCWLFFCWSTSAITKPTHSLFTFIRKKVESSTWKEHCTHASIADRNTYIHVHNFCLILCYYAHYTHVKHCWNERHWRRNNSLASLLRPL